MNTARAVNLPSFDLFPFPVGVFAADGSMMFANRTLLELHGMADTGLNVGKYNLLTDPVCNDRMGLRDTIKRVFSGEAVTIQDFRPPVQVLVDRGVIKEKPYESALMEVYLSPIMDKDTLIFVVCVIIVKNIYRGKPEVARAKEYLSLNWRGKYNPRLTAKALDTSVARLYRLFKQYEGMTPGTYHQHCKIEHIKEKLNDKNLTVREAFKACGEDSRGWIQNIFKEMTGVTPTEFRKQKANEK